MCGSEQQQQLTKKDKKEFNRCVRQAQSAEHRFAIEEARHFYTEALQIVQGTQQQLQIERKLVKLSKSYTVVQGTNFVIDIKNKIVHLGEDFAVDQSIFGKLWSQQRDGVAFLYRIHKSDPSGGILGDDMGCGKTIQVLAFLAGLFRSEMIKNALISVPKSVFDQWKSAAADWCPNVLLRIFSSGNSSSRSSQLQCVRTQGGICLTTHSWQLLEHFVSTDSSPGFIWDYLILDEGHVIKNPKARTTQVLGQIPSRHRLLLTGTPITNKLEEIWSLFNWACEGRLLGDRKKFLEFEIPIKKGNDKYASQYEINLGIQLAKSLQNVIEPHFIRRLKNTKVMSPSPAKARKTSAEFSNPRPRVIFSQETSVSSSHKEDHVHSGCLRAKKNDLIVWIKLTKHQEDRTRQFLSTSEIGAVLRKEKQPFVAIQILKDICSHPRLHHSVFSKYIAPNEESFSGSDNESSHSESSCSDSSSNSSSSSEISTSGDYDTSFLPNSDVLLEESTKLSLLFSLLLNFQENGHRTLVFSQFMGMLDIIQEVLVDKKIRFCRIDGTVSGNRRTEVISLFEIDKDILCLLLTSKCGSHGLNLTAADRVIIFDPSWSTSDNQAADRAYRWGQSNDVIIYRFITCGTIEEKIYQRQVFKDGMGRTMTDAPAQSRYFSLKELHQLFQFENSDQSKTQKDLAVRFKDRIESCTIREHISWFENIPQVFGISHHDWLYDEKQPLTGKEDKQIIDHVKKATTGLQESARTPFAKTKRHRKISDSPLKIPESKCFPLGRRKVATTPLIQQSEKLSGTCKFHRDAARPIFVTKCRCKISPSKKSSYDTLLEDTQNIFFNTTTITQSFKWKALENMLNMLEYCDDDIALHSQITRVAGELSLL